MLHSIRNMVRRRNYRKVMMVKRLVEIEGQTAVTDPAQKSYDTASKRLTLMSWEEFEDLVASLLEEVGFCDVHRLTRGSQHGRDIVATWESRFSLGTAVRFRFQCKHKETDSLIRKRNVGDSISDFLLQQSDEILVLVTNGTFSNDLMKQMDDANDRGLYSICRNQLIRFISACPKTASERLNLDVDFRSGMRHFFELRDYFETLSSVLQKNSFIMSLHRFWTEPYVWFFMKNREGEIERYWTTRGGEFRLTCHNNSQEIQDISGLTLSLVAKEELPKFGVTNMTPKGGHGIKRVHVELSDQLGDFDLGTDAIQYLNTGESYNTIIAFAGRDPGIYHFQIQCRGAGGSTRMRESPVYKIAYIPDPPPKQYVSLLERWPSALLSVEKLLSMSNEERVDKIGEEGGRVLLYRHHDGELRYVYSKADDGKIHIVPEMPYEPCKHPLSGLVMVMESRQTFGQSFERLYQWSAWCEEWLDQSEPRGPLGRAGLLAAQKADTNLIHDALLKAYERTPWHPKINAFVSQMYYELGYLGFCQFHLQVAYIAAPSNPVIAGLHYLLMKKLKKQPRPEAYLASLGEEGMVGFHNLIKRRKFPTSYRRANELAFPNDEGMRERWSSQIW